jgi:hypothetical protein
MHIDKPLGNIFSKSLREIWNGEEYVKFRMSFIKGEESFCEIVLRALSTSIISAIDY